jgi:hypothetical protein
LPNCNCLPSMCYLSYGETPLVNCGPRSYFHHIAITCLLYSHTIITFHSICSYPLFQANRWDWQPHRKLGTKYLVVLCAGSKLLLAEDESASVINGALVGVLLSQSASPSVVLPALLLRENLATIFITPSSWGSQRASHLPRIRTPVQFPLHCYTIYFYSHCLLSCILLRFTTW